MRIFLVGFAVGAIVIVAGSSLVKLLACHGQLVLASNLPMTLQHLAMGMVLGLAVGTTDWTNLSLVGWWQLWWTVALLLLYIAFLAQLRKASRP